MQQFEQRLAALASAHNVILDHHWGPAGLKEVIERALAPLGVRHRVIMSGPDTLLGPSSVTAYLLGLHELLTNALKHGALSVAEGTVTISWKAQGDRVHLTWKENDGPAPPTDPKPGAGTRLLERVVSAELGTRVRIDFQKTGLVCEFDGPTQKEPDLHSPLTSPG
jgi:two-component sensor histidine kinase